jgi:hypothetical protein
MPVAPPAPAAALGVLLPLLPLLCCCVEVDGASDKTKALCRAGCLGPSALPLALVGLPQGVGGALRLKLLQLRVPAVLLLVGEWGSERWWWWWCCCCFC